MKISASRQAVPTLLRLSHVINATGLPRSTLWRQIKHGLLPQPVKLSQRCVAWPAAEIAAINAARIAGKTDRQIRALVQRLHQQRPHAAIDIDTPVGVAP